MAFYSKKEYWEQRYALNTQPYEWYLGYEELKDVLPKYVRQGSRVMVAGCGNSTLGEELYDRAGLTDITCIDFCEAPIEVMMARKEGREGLNYIVADLKDLHIPSGAYDVIIDKGCLDAATCGDNERAIVTTARPLISEISRVLRPNGVYLCLSHTPEEGRQILFQKNLAWAVTVETIPKDDGVGLGSGDYSCDDYPHYFIYVCKKKKDR
eukprot:TRINITY_DN11130_c0_g1_i1.p2 TRINITY_DN11130_c0_g1~~TRINITY_DN11130_c0_g1_i1.p2  ORF type:complete len:210 (+),score=83.03 TRINITY_DN11130_c0_g1_i1:118-747(+)